MKSHRSGLSPSNNVIKDRLVCLNEFVCTIYWHCCMQPKFFRRLNCCVTCIGLERQLFYNILQHLKFLSVTFNSIQLLRLDLGASWNQHQKRTSINWIHKISVTIICLHQRSSVRNLIKNLISTLSCDNFKRIWNFNVATVAKESQTAISSDDSYSTKFFFSYKKL